GREPAHWRERWVSAQLRPRWQRRSQYRQVSMPQGPRHCRSLLLFFSWGFSRGWLVGGTAGHDPGLPDHGRWCMNLLTPDLSDRSGRRIWPEDALCAYIDTLR